MEKKKRKTVWFVEPIGAHTNRIIAQFLIKDIDEIVQESINIKDVGRVNAYEVDHKVITHLKTNWNLTFHIYRKQGNGQIEKWYFPKRKVIVGKKHKAV